MTVFPQLLRHVSTTINNCSRVNLSPRVSAWATYSAEDSPAVVPYSHTTASKGSKRSQRHSTNTGILWNLGLKLTQRTAEQVCEFTPTLPTSQLIHSHLAQRHLDHAHRELLQFRQRCVQLDQLHSREAQVQASLPAMVWILCYAFRQL